MIRIRFKRFDSVFDGFDSFVIRFGLYWFALAFVDIDLGAIRFGFGFGCRLQLTGFDSFWIRFVSDSVCAV